MQDEQPTKEQSHIRVVTYMCKHKHRRMKAKLALRGLSVSEWWRRAVDKLIRE